MKRWYILGRKKILGRKGNAAQLVAQQIKRSPTMAVLNVNADLSHGHSTSDTDTCSMAGKATEDGQRVWAPTILVKDPDRVPASTIQVI